MNGNVATCWISASAVHLVRWNLLQFFSTLKWPHLRIWSVVQKGAIAGRQIREKFENKNANSQRSSCANDTANLAKCQTEFGTKRLQASHWNDFKRTVSEQTAWDSWTISRYLQQIGRFETGDQLATIGSNWLRSMGSIAIDCDQLGHRSVAFSGSTLEDAPENRNDLLY